MFTSIISVTINVSNFVFDKIRRSEMIQHAPQSVTRLLGEGKLGDARLGNCSYAGGGDVM